jgi:predicted nucleotidyltransferase
MRPSEALAAHREEIRRVVTQNRACNPRIFGSVLRGEDSETSDLDLLVDATPEASLFDIARIQGELEDLLGLKVDVVTSNGLHPRMRDRVIAEAMPV